MRRCLSILFALTLVGCSRQDMHDQPKYKPQRPSEFFADGRSNRPEVEGTVARGSIDNDSTPFEDIETFPVAVDKPLLLRGQQRYDIYCAPCHGRIGNGLGMIVRRGFKQPPSYHIERLRTASVGHYYNVITNGYGAMLNYASQIQPRDRWAIVAYIRALQYSQNAPVAELSAESRARVGVAVSPELQAALKMQPLAPSDPDFTNFPAKSAMPAEVPTMGSLRARPAKAPETQSK